MSASKCFQTNFLEFREIIGQILFRFSLFIQISDKTESIKCSGSQGQFGLDYTTKSKLAKILDCNSHWDANKWTIESLLLRGDGEWRWKANFVDESGLVKNTSDQVKLTGCKKFSILQLTFQGILRPASELLWMKETQNLTLRLFDAIGVHQTAKDLRQNLEYNEEERRTDKTELRKEYSMPEILKQDIFKTCQVWFLRVLKNKIPISLLQILTDYQWTLVSGPNTGTDLHLDPPFAQSWNTLLQGHKLWAVFPPDTEPRLWECDPKCSG